MSTTTVSDVQSRYRTIRKRHRELYRVALHGSTPRRAYDVALSIVAQEFGYATKTAGTIVGSLRRLQREAKV